MHRHEPQSSKGANSALPAHNHITYPSGYTYDAAGNLTSDGYCSYTYDGEERMATASCPGSGMTTYIYDAEGRRVAKAAGSSITEEYVNDLAGQRVSTYGPYPAMTWVRDDIWVGGRHLATYANGTTYFNHADGLGTERARTAVNGSVYETCTSLPFGDGQSCTAADPTPNHFTGLPRDTETGNDSAMFRYFDSAQGRWMSPDPLGGDFTNPQSLNRYAYVMNYPTRFTDPLGLGPQGIDCVAHPNRAACGGDAIGSGMDGTCYLDGIQTSCSVVLGSIASGFGVQCPGPCSGFTTGQYGVPIFVQYWAFPGAAGVANGYYPGLGPLNPDSLAIYMTMAYHSFSLQNKQEIGGQIYEDIRAGIYAATVEPPGELEGVWLKGSTPSNGAFVGNWWTEVVGDAFNEDDAKTSLNNAGQQMFSWISTSQDRVLRNNGPGTTCVLVGPSQGYQSSYLMTWYPSCH